MPIYEFICQACGTEIEVLQKISDPHPTDCEACGKAEMKKKVTAAAFRLSGAGWYETDFKKESDNKKNLTETNADNTNSDNKKSVKDSPENKKETRSSTSNSKETSAKGSSKSNKTEKPKSD